MALIKMLYTNRILIAVAATLMPLSAIVCADQSKGAVLIVDSMIVTLIDDNRIPASETGMIAQIKVSEGDSVSAGDSLGNLDDRQVLIEGAAARTQLKIAVEKSETDRAAELAQKDLAEAKQTAKEHQLLLEIAQRKAGNETRVLASKKSQEVAKNELDRATRARSKFVDSISQSEIDGYRLAFDRTRLESDQAEFERQNDKLQARAEQSAATGHRLRIEKSTIEVERAVADKQIRILEVQLHQQQYELAELAAERHKFALPSTVLSPRSCIAKATGSKRVTQ